MPIWILAFFLAAQDPRTQTCALSGTVVNSLTGVPLGKVELLAQGTQQGVPPFSTFTDAKGNFAMVNLPPGQYRLKGHRNGYLDSYYGARRPGSGGTAIVLESGQEMKDVQVKLAPFGAISGTVRDTDGEPMSGAEVVLYRQSYENGHREIRPAVELTTDDQGQYRASDLEPGKYFLRAAARSRNDYGFMTPVDHSRNPADTPPVLLPTFFPGVVDPAASRTVEVDVGERLSGIDITLVRSRVFRVTVKASGGPGISLREAWLFNAPPGLQMKTQTRNPAGDFEFYAVPAGSYTLEVSAQADEALARVPLLVGGDLEGVRVTVGSPAEVSGRVTVEGSDKVETAGERMLFDSGTDNIVSSVIDQKHTFTRENLSGVLPGLPGHGRAEGDRQEHSLRRRGRLRKGTHRRRFLQGCIGGCAGGGGRTGGWRGARRRRQACPGSYGRIDRGGETAFALRFLS
ncbi:MAG: carboxypeptidase regulatory-like domain-containing protein [Candidatus Sulfopaludibacter sp.]|nr:carboxypeptidase regulatory-like domain-containing protein [Candidatus Sulfopaludibacter sp.]